MAASPADWQRITLRYRGHVQGVGFRARARHVAGGFGVTGYVRNLPDGSVEVVAEGEPGALGRLVDALATEMAGLIRSTETDIGPATGEFTGFEIRR